MPALMEVEETPLATGTTVSAWLHGRCVELQDLTGRGLPARVICIGSSAGLADAMDLSEGITDPRASHRSITSGRGEWARNLSHLAVAARLIIPNLRGMTPAEQSNLRRFYRGVYRKA